MWGFITVLVDSLIPRLKEVFELTYFQAGLVQFAFFLAYGLLSIPSGAILSKIGYKKGIILGLSVMGLGALLFYPAAEFRQFWIFLIGYFVLAGGMTVLQVAANPYVAVLGDENSAASRLTLSQAFNSLGASIAPLFGAMFLLSDKIMSTDEINAMSETAKSTYMEGEASAVQLPFVILAGALILLAFVVSRVKLPNILSGESTGSYAGAWAHKNLKMGTLGIFLYVGAEVAIGSYLVSYFISMGMPELIKGNEFMSGIASSLLGGDLANVDSKAIVGAFVTFYWTGAMVGRFVGAYLNKILKPSTVLSVFALIAVSLLLISMNTTGFVAMWSILLVGLFNSIIFPTIFTLSLEGLGENKPQASGILCTAIVGGAIVPPLYGYMTDLTGFKIALFVMIACYAYIYFFAKKSKNFASA
ncbi:MAG: sugar MFS transporter [Flavobacteriaceae bacterium]